MLDGGLPGEAFPGVLDGGLPGEAFPGVLDGGLPGEAFPGVLDGGPPGEAFPGVLDGGPPGEAFPGVLDDGLPGEAFPGVLDGGPPLSDVEPDEVGRAAQYWATVCPATAAAASRFRNAVEFPLVWVLWPEAVKAVQRPAAAGPVADGPTAWLLWGPPAWPAPWAAAP